MTYGLDTSAVLRLLMCEPPSLAQKVKDRVDALLADGHDFEMSDLVVSEIYYALQDYYGQSKKEAIELIRAIANTPGFFVSQGVRSALELPDLHKAAPGFMDRVLAAGYASKGRVTISCDKDFRKLDLAEVIKE